MSSSSRSTFLAFVIFGFLAILAALAFRMLERPQAALPDGLRLKSLDVVPLANGAAPLSLADLAGKTVLINFWGPWCGPCRQEFPHIQALANQHRDRADFLVLSISNNGPPPEDLTHSRQLTEVFLKEGGYTLPIYADPLGKTRLGLREAVDPGVYPATVLIDREGKAIAAWLGFREAVFEQIKLKVAGELAR
jgi:cytochrome c biogenesis protein CcmG/thiol:disulfide interchange protein DsbE